jgi:hypothetical protein
VKSPNYTYKKKPYLLQRLPMPIPDRLIWRRGHGGGPVFGGENAGAETHGGEERRVGERKDKWKGVDAPTGIGGYKGDVQMVQFS